MAGVFFQKNSSVEAFSQASYGCVSLSPSQLSLSVKKSCLLNIQQHYLVIDKCLLNERRDGQFNNKLWKILRAIFLGPGVSICIPASVALRSLTEELSVSALSIPFPEVQTLLKQPHSLVSHFQAVLQGDRHRFQGRFFVNNIHFSILNCMLLMYSSII